MSNCRNLIDPNPVQSGLINYEGADSWISQHPFKLTVMDLSAKAREDKNNSINY